MKTQVDLGLVSIEEISALDDTTVLQAVNLQTGTFALLEGTLIQTPNISGWRVRVVPAGWMIESKNGSAAGGQSSEYIFTSDLGAVTSGANNATLRYFFSTFDSNKLITTGML